MRFLFVTFLIFSQTSLAGITGRVANNIFNNIQSGPVPLPIALAFGVPGAGQKIGSTSPYVIPPLAGFEALSTKSELRTKSLIALTAKDSLPGSKTGKALYKWKLNEYCFINQHLPKDENVSGIKSDTAWHFVGAYQEPPYMGTSNAKKPGDSAWTTTMMFTNPDGVYMVLKCRPKTDSKIENIEQFLKYLGQDKVTLNLNNNVKANSPIEIRGIEDL